MTDTTIKGISPVHLFWACGLFILGMAGTVFGGGMAWSDIKNSIDKVSTKVDKLEERVTRIETNQNASNMKIDTIAHRQDVDRIENSYHYQIQQSQVRHGTEWVEQIRDSRGKIHLKPTTNP